MEAKKINDKILIEITKEEAIVFLNWLTEFNEKNNQEIFQDQAEERILWDFEAVLEKVIDETFDENYIEILSNARKKIRD